MPKKRLNEVNKKDYSTNYFKSSDIRECRFYIEELKLRNITPKIIDDIGNLNTKLVCQYNENNLFDISKIINDTIFVEYKDKDSVVSFINEIRELMNQKVVSTELINSLFESELMMLYSWVYIKITTSLFNVSYRDGVVISQKSNPIESNSISNSKSLMSKTLSSLLDSLSGSKIEKELFIHQINVEYTTSASNLRNSFSWVKKGDIKESERILKSLIRDINKKDENSEWNKTAIDACQYIFIHNHLAAIYILLYVSLCKNTEKEKSVRKILKSWEQMNYRKKIKNNKTTIDTDNIPHTKKETSRPFQEMETNEIINYLMKEADWSSI